MAKKWFPDAADSNAKWLAVNMSKNPLAICCSVMAQVNRRQLRFDHDRDITVHLRLFHGRLFPTMTTQNFSPSYAREISYKLRSGIVRLLE